MYMKRQRKYQVFLGMLIMFLSCLCTNVYAEYDIENIFEITGYISDYDNNEYLISFDKKIEECYDYGALVDTIMYSINNREYQHLTDNDMAMVINDNGVIIVFAQPIQGETVKFKFAPDSLIDVKTGTNNSNNIISEEINIYQPSEIYLSDYSLRLYEGEVKTISLWSEGHIPTNKLIWEIKSEESKVASIQPTQEKCKIYAKSEGSMIVRVYSTDGKIDKSCSIEVIPYNQKGIGVESIEVPDMTLHKGERQEIIHYIGPDDANIKGWSYSIEDEDIVQIVNDTITGLKEGETIVTITVIDMDDNQIQEKFIVRVEEKENIFLVGTPIANLESGQYIGPQFISLSTDNDLDVIYYTVDGTQPSENSHKYDGNFIYIDKGTTFKALAVDRYGHKSNIVEYNYIIIEDKDIEVEFNIISKWNTGFQAEIILTNKSKRVLEN